MKILYFIKHLTKISDEIINNLLIFLIKLISVSLLYVFISI